MKLPAHEATTAQLGALYPFAASAPLPVRSVFVGRDLLGGVFFHDPFALYRAGVLTNPNMIVIGQLGRGKSSFVKTYLYRQAAFGRRIVVFDPKGEYGPLAAALGTTPVKLSCGGSIRLNPLDVAPGDGREQASLRRLELLIGVTAAVIGRMVLPKENAALELALREVESTSGTPTLSQVVERLLDPFAPSAQAIGSDLATLRADGRDVALELRRLVTGDLRGMFDGATTPGVRLDAEVVVLDLSAMFRSAALGALIACATAALESTWRTPSTQTIVVVDEAWAVLSNIGAARFLQASWKLARAYGVANIAVVHRVSDLSSSANDGDLATKLTRGLLSDCETVVTYAQAESEVDDCARTLGFDENCARLVTRLRRAVALWKVAERIFLVEHRIGPDEVELVFTDGRILASGADSRSA